MSRTTELYQQVLLDHNKVPRNYGKLIPHSHHACGHNPLCGDKIDIYLVLKDEIICDVKFESCGCAISRASASLMTQAIKGKTFGEFQTVFEEFQRLVKGELIPEKEENHLGKLKIFSGIWEYPSRIKCAILSWHCAKKAMAGGGVVKTE